MTGPFVKNKPALQLLPSPASVSWVLQREAWEPADQCLDRSVLCWGGGVGVERELLGTGSHTSCWRSAQMGLDRTARAREDTVACISNQTPTSRERERTQVSGSLLPFNLGRVLAYVCLWNCRCPSLLRWSQDQRVISQKESSEEWASVSNLMTIFISLRRTGSLQGGKWWCGNMNPVPCLSPALLSCSNDGPRGLQAAIKPFMRGAWVCAEVTRLKCPLPPHQKNF